MIPEKLNLDGSVQHDLFLLFFGKERASKRLEQGRTSGQICQHRKRSGSNEGPRDLLSRVTRFVESVSKHQWKITALFNGQNLTASKKNNLHLLS